MYIFTYSDWAFLPIVFKIVNASGEGDYFNGIPPDQESEDDITRLFSDRKESCLSEAIYYLKNGSFPPPKGTKTRYAPVKKPAYKDLLKRKYLK